MAEATITRSEVIVVDSVEYNDYQDLVFTAKGNDQPHKIGNKRTGFFKDVLISGQAVKLNYASAYGKEYIYNAQKVSDKLPPPTEPQVSEREQKVVEKAGSAAPMPQDRDKRIVFQVVMKEVGELYRAGLLVEDKDHPVDRKLIAKYKNWIYKTLGVSVQHKEG